MTIPQYRLPMIILMFAWPAAWFTLLIYVLAPRFLDAGGSLPSWAFLLVWFLGNGAELVVALIILRREGLRFSWRQLKDRLRLRWPDRLWKWLLVPLLFVAAFVLSNLLAPAQGAVAQALPPPDWMPGHPLKPVESLQAAYPDLSFKGNYGFVFVRFFILGLVLNIIGEELYYRGVLLPKMRGVFGRFDWLANGIGFTLKHAYFYWRLPFLWVGGLAFAFAAGPLGSLPVALIYHWIGNLEPFQLLQALKLAAGG